MCKKIHAHIYSQTCTLVEININRIKSLVKREMWSEYVEHKKGNKKIESKRMD